MSLPADERRISVVIINYNGMRRLPGTLHSVATCGWPFEEIVVVDDGSTDGSREWLAATHPAVVLIGPEHNTARTTRLRNIGLLRCRTPFVLLLDNDIGVLPGAVEALLDALRAHPEALCATPRLIDRDHPGLVYADGNQLHFLGLSAAALRNALLEELPPRRPHPTFGGGIMLIRMEHAREVGGFDEELLLGWADDAEFHLRGRFLGHPALHVGASRMLHEAKRHGMGRAYAQIVNRHRVVLTYFSGRSLLLLAPSLVAFEFALLFVAFARGFARDYLRALRHTWRSRHGLREHRAWLQARRCVTDRELLVGGEFELPGAAPRGAWFRLGTTLAGALFGLNWRLARRFL